MKKHLLAKARVTGRIEMTVLWDRRQTHEQSVAFYASVDRELRLHLDSLDTREREMAAIELLQRNKSYRTRAQTPRQICKSTGVREHRVKELRRDLRRAHKGNSPPHGIDLLSASLEELAKIPGLEVVG